MRSRHAAAALAATAAVTLAAPIANTAPHHGRTYYVDCSATAPGDGSRQYPWTTLTEANSQAYGPGDHLFFKRGATCTGSLIPKEIGSALRAVHHRRLRRRPSPRPPRRRRGPGRRTALQHPIRARQRPGADQLGQPRRHPQRHPAAPDRLRDRPRFRARPPLHPQRPGTDFKALGGSSAIQITVEGTAKASSYDGLDIHHNRIEDVDREGIYFKSTFSKRDLVGEQQDPNAFPGAWTPSTHVRIHHNTLTDLAGDGIKLDTTSGARVDHNRVDGFQLRSPSANAGVWTFNTDATTIEYNEVSGGGNTHDGMSFDADGASRGTVFQYNHSHDNKGGFLLICPYSGAKTLDTVARYNISSNDGARLVQNCWGPILNTRIYNNTFRNDASTTPGYLVQDDAGAPPPPSTNSSCGTTSS